MAEQNSKQLLYIDLFCGAGGTSTGINSARLHGRRCADVIACVNHDAKVIASHAANHPGALHLTEDIRTFIGNAVEVNMARSWCEALCAGIEKQRNKKIA